MRYVDQRSHDMNTHLPKVSVCLFGNGEGEQLWVRQDKEVKTQGHRLTGSSAGNILTGKICESSSAFSNLRFLICLLLLSSLERVVTIYDDKREEIVTYVSTCGSKAVE